MIVNKVYISTFISMFLSNTVAYSSMASMSSELLNQLSDKSSSAIEMLGDLQEGATTKTGIEIRDCLLGNGPCEQSVSRVSY